MTLLHDIEDERRELVPQKYSVGLTEDEEQRLAEIRAGLDRVEAEGHRPCRAVCTTGHPGGDDDRVDERQSQDSALLVRLVGRLAR